MDLHHSSGQIRALETLGLAKNASAMKNFIHHNKPLVASTIIGTALAAGTLASKKEPAPRMERPYIEGNPLTYEPQH